MRRLEREILRSYVVRYENAPDELKIASLLEIYQTLKKLLDL